MAEKLQKNFGPQIRKLRYHQGLTQEMFAARCTIRGMELSRATLSKVEARLRCVTDQELEVFAEALGVEIKVLYPAKRK